MVDLVFVGGVSRGRGFDCESTDCLVIFCVAIFAVVVCVRWFVKVVLPVEADGLLRFTDFEDGFPEVVRLVVA